MKSLVIAVNRRFTAIVNDMKIVIFVSAGLVLHKFTHCPSNEFIWHNYS